MLLTEVDIFIQDGYLEELMKHIIGQLLPIADPVLWLNLAKNSQMSITYAGFADWTVFSPVYEIILSELVNVLFFLTKDFLAHQNPQGVLT